MTEGAGESRWRVRRILGGAAGVITAVSVAVGLLFTVAPNLRPCLGDTDAEFTGAPVFPKVMYHDHLLRNGATQDALEGEPNLMGSEVRFSYRTTGFRGSTLTITWTLIAIERDETLGAVQPGQDRAVAMTFSPNACSEGGGKDLFVPIPEPGRRYLLVLELYRDRDPDLGERIAFTQTDPFRG